MDYRFWKSKLFTCYVVPFLSAVAVAIYHYYHYNNVLSEPYTFRSARVHLARVLDLVRASGPQDALREGRSPSVLESLTHTQTTGTLTYCALTQEKSDTKWTHSYFSYTYRCRLELTQWKGPETLFEQHKNGNNQPGGSSTWIPSPRLLRETLDGPTTTDLPTWSTYQHLVWHQTSL